jgi:hypothetical protein
MLRVGHGGRAMRMGSRSGDVRHLLAVVVAAGVGLLGGRAQAQDEGLESSLEEASGPSLQVHGFVSQGFIKSTGNNYLAESKRGSFEMTEGAVNLTASVTERLRLGFQLFVRDLGPIGNYGAKMDWMYFDYRLADWLGVRAGRVKIPFGLYNEIADVDPARVAVLLPQSVYPTGNRDFLLALTGGELHGRLRLAAAGALEYRLYGGTVFIEGGAAIGPLILSAPRVPYVAGARLMWETPVDGLRVGGSGQLIRIDWDLAITGLGATNVKFPVRLWLASLEYAAGPVHLAAEYGRWHGKIISSNPLLVPNVDTVNERLYGMGAYRLTGWLQVGAYYALLFPNKEDRKGRSAWQHDYAATLRFDINDYWLLKLEGHFMRGTAGLDDNVNKGLNGNRPLAQLERNWAVFLAKSTVYF